VDKKQLDTLRAYAEAHKINLISKNDAIERFFFYIFERRGILVCMNTCFELSRLAISFNTSKLDKSAFTLKISEDRRLPCIYTKYLNSHHAFIRFIAPRSRSKKDKNHYQGVFIDVKTLVFALTNKNYTLGKACELFNTEYKKQKAKQHGVIDDEYIDYNIADVRATYSLYKALLKRIEDYNIPIEPYEISSPASIGPAYYRAMGIKPFMEQCPQFNRQQMGYALMGYFGGRVETRWRKTVIPSTYCDATSMYPSNFVRMKLWDFVIANEIVIEEDLEFKEFLENVKLEDLTDNKVWASKLRGMALVEVDDDIFPVRGHYGDKVVNGIGVNYVKGGRLWFAYPDIAAAVLLGNGKIPKVVRSLKFTARGVQQGLQPIKLFGNVISPTSDLIKYLIERRLRIKKLLKNDPDNENLKNEDHIAKIICNSCSYGKTVQVNVIDARKRLTAQIPAKH
jgi:hypothetical protein